MAGRQDTVIGNLKKTKKKTQLFRETETGRDTVLPGHCFQVTVEQLQ